MNGIWPGPWNKERGAEGAERHGAGGLPQLGGRFARPWRPVWELGWTSCCQPRPDPHGHRPGWQRNETVAFSKAQWPVPWVCYGSSLLCRYSAESSSPIKSYSYLVNAVDENLEHNVFTQKQNLYFKVCYPLV